MAVPGLGPGIAPAAAASFGETFDGAPATPLPWEPANWDVTVHSRDTGTWNQLETMAAQHGPDCAGPPSTHVTSSYEGAVFLCRDHVMTAIQAGGYGLIYLTPDQLIDFSGGEAVLSFDMSTLRTAQRDWVDVWVTPFDDHHQLAFEDGDVDLQGPPRRAVHLVMDLTSNSFQGEVYNNFQVTDLPSRSTPYDNVLVPDAARRDRFELRISTNRIRFGMPAKNLWWVDTTIPNLGWSSGVVQLGHHSYNPTKDCSGPCSANTWHWDNVSINPAKPFTMIKADRRFVTDGTSNVLRFTQPAPANAFLRFAGIGENLQVSFNNGASWTAAVRQSIGGELKEHQFQSFWTPVPAGTKQVLVRGSGGWWGDWHVRDISIWANSSAPPPTSNDYSSLQPFRLLDTRAPNRTGDGGFSGQGLRPAGSVLQLTVAGRGGVPANATAAVLNLTAADAVAGGFVTVFPCGSPRPTASSLNFARRTAVANAVFTKLGGGRACLYTSATTQLIADVSGYFPATATYRPINPARLFDTRVGGMRPARSILQVAVGGRAGIPANAAGAVLNVTAVAPAATGFLTVFPCGSARPNASSLNFRAGGVAAGSVVTKLGAGSRVCIFTSARTHLLVDANGFFPAGSSYRAANPARLLDSRPGAATVDGQYRSLGARPTGSTLQLQLGGRGGVPYNPVSVVLTLTAIGVGRSAGYVTVYPCGARLPNASNLNHVPGVAVANTVVTKLGTAGTVCLYTYGAAHLLVDVSGYFPAQNQVTLFRQRLEVPDETLAPEPYYCELV
jgi:hypothetical protein